MSLQSVTEVCRLCPTTTNLVHVFDKRIVNDNMRDVVYISTGVEIHEKDIISQKVCAKCCNIALRMFKFRQDAAKHDKLLKEKCSELLKEKEIKIPNTSITIKREVKAEDSSRKRPLSPLQKKTDHKVITKRKKENPIHHSVASLFGLYPNLKLPTKSLKSDILPVVSLKMGEVENYFKSRKLDMKKFISHPKTRVAKKKTTSINKTTKISSERPHQTQCNEKKKKTSDSEESTKSQKIRLSDSAESRKVKQLDSKKSVGTLKIKLSTTPKHTITNSISGLDPKQNETLISKGESTKSPEKSLNNATSDTSSTLSLVDKSVPLLMCNICSAIEYSAKDLKRHLNKHLVCQFCKTRFKTLDLKSEHIDKHCIVKKIMNNPGPEIVLEKVDLDVDIRKKYYKTFKDFPKLPNMVDEVESSDNDDVVVCDSESNNDVIELLSDDEDLPVAIVSDHTSDKIGGLKSTKTSPVPSANLAPVEENITYTTVSIVKPDIKIKGNNNLLSRIEPTGTDVNVIKDLLSLIRQPRSTVVERMVQTEMPINKEIKINPDMTCEFKNLKEHMCVYKIPVIIKNGAFNVTYNYHTENKSSKPVNNWDHLRMINHINPSSGPTPAAGPRQQISNSTTSTLVSYHHLQAIPVNNSGSGTNTYIINQPSTAIANNIPIVSIATTNVSNTNGYSNSAQISNGTAGYYSNTTVFKPSNPLSSSGNIMLNSGGSVVQQSAKLPIYNSIVPPHTMSTITPVVFSTGISAVPISTNSNVVNTVNSVIADVRTSSAVYNSQQQASLNSQTENAVTNAATFTPVVTPVHTTNIRVKSVKELQ